ncbi:MAG TPA: hypothetical protein VHB21_21445 [Minicystis sp.]|nr:hypothetical protein [Minicystis sp.]
MKSKLRVGLAWIGLAAAAAIAGSAGCGGGGGSGGGGGAAADPCFDYSGYKGDSPTTQFRKDVLPIFRRSCGLSSSCHGPDPSGVVNLPQNQPYLGPPEGGPNPNDADIAKILGGIVDRSAEIPGSPDPKPEPDGYKIVNPGHPETSFMMFKIDAVLGSDGTSTFCSKLKCAPNGGCGYSMPQNGPELASADKETIRRWIAQGAKDD